MVPGRTFPVEVFYLEEEKNSDIVDLAVDTALKIHESDATGDILIFLTGEHEINRACKLLTTKFDLIRRKRPTSHSIIPLPLYAALPPSEQVKVFLRTPPSARKIVFSTNISETSVTIDGIEHVIDPGFVKQKIFSAKTGMESLQIVSISKVAATQRAGRAGRTKPGNCYRLYTKQYFSQMPEETQPEIQRSNLTSVVLMLKAMKVKDVLVFPFIDPPEPMLVVQALKSLYLLEALDESGDITSIGSIMASLPLDPVYARTLIAASVNQCAEEMATIVALLSVDNLVLRNESESKIEKKRKKIFRKFEGKIDHHCNGDHLFFLSLCQKYQKSKKKEKFCEKVGVNHKKMEDALEIRKQLVSTLNDLKIPVLSTKDLETCSQRISKSFAHGLFINAAKKVTSSDDNYHIIGASQQAQIHPSCSILYSKLEKPLSYIVFGEMLTTSKTFLKFVVGVKFDWLQELFERRTKMDLNKIVGKDVKDLIKELMEGQTQSQQPLKGEKQPEKRQHQDQISQAPKMDKKNDENSIQAARDRYLQRKQTQKK